MSELASVRFTRLELVALQRELRDVVDSGGYLLPTDEDRRAAVTAAAKVIDAHAKLVGVAVGNLVLSPDAGRLFVKSLLTPAPAKASAAAAKATPAKGRKAPRRPRPSELAKRAARQASETDGDASLPGVPLASDDEPDYQ